MFLPVYNVFPFLLNQDQVIGDGLGEDPVDVRLRDTRTEGEVGDRSVPDSNTLQVENCHLVVIDHRPPPPAGPAAVVVQDTQLLVYLPAVEPGDHLQFDFCKFCNDSVNLGRLLMDNKWHNVGTLFN